LIPLALFDGLKFLKDAGIQGEEDITKYVEIFNKNKINADTLSVLTSEQRLEKMGITSAGDIARIIKATEAAQMGRYQLLYLKLSISLPNYNQKSY
jgi:hypothetical protein